MRIDTNEHYKLMEYFEKIFSDKGRMDREPKYLWPKRRLYQDGEINFLFLAYRDGYAAGKSIYQQ